MGKNIPIWGSTNPGIFAQQYSKLAEFKPTKQQVFSTLLYVPTNNYYITTLTIY